MKHFDQMGFLARPQGKHAVTLTNRRTKIIANETIIRIRGDAISSAAEGWNT
jgi:hypothetical protein